jgi:hypothetical protein
VFDAAPSVPDTAVISFASLISPVFLCLSFMLCLLGLGRILEDCLSGSTIKSKRCTSHFRDSPTLVRCSVSPEEWSTSRSHTIQALVTLVAPIVSHLTPETRGLSERMYFRIFFLPAFGLAGAATGNAVRGSAKPLYALYVLVTGPRCLFPGSRLARCAASVGDQACMTHGM